MNKKCNIIEKLYTPYIQKVITKEWGAEWWLINTENYCCKILVINPKMSGSIHMHRIKAESFFVLEGRVKLDVWRGRTREVYTGQKLGVTIKNNVYHRFSNISETERTFIMEISTKHTEKDVVRILDKEVIKEMEEVTVSKIVKG